MKLLNYDCRTLIMRNVRCTAREIPEAYTQAQYQILCRLIKQKGITKNFFHFLLMQLYNLSDWKQLDYRQMYELIHVLTYYYEVEAKLKNYQKFLAKLERSKANLERDIDNILDDDKNAERKRTDMNKRLDKIYNEIYDTEDKISECEQKWASIE